MKEVFHYIGHGIFIPAAMWLWNERRILKEVIEDGLERRHEHKGEIDMTNPIADIQLALTIMAQLRTALPTLAKGLQDLKQAWADKSDSTKVANDLVQWLNDNEPLINQILALVPQAQVPNAPTTPPPPTIPAV